MGLLPFWWCANGPVWAQASAQELDSDAALSATYNAAIISGIALALVIAAVLIAWRALDARAAFEREVELRKAQLDTAIAHMSQGLVTFDAQGRVVLLNNRYIEMYGLSPEAAKPGITFRALLQHRKDRGAFADDVDAYHDAVVQSLSNDSHAPVLTEPLPGRFFDVVNRPIAGGGWVATHDDVTERQILLAAQAAAEEIAQQQKVQLEAALNNMIHGLAMYDAEGRVVLFNNKYATMLGHDPDTLLGRSLLDLMRDSRTRGADHTDPEKLFAEILAASRRGGSTPHLFKTKGRLLRAMDQAMPGGGWVAIFEDITEHTRIEAERARIEADRDRNRELLNMIVDNVPSTIYVKTAHDRKYVMVNRAGEKFWARSREAMIGKTADDFFPPEEAAKITQREDELLALGQPVFDERDMLTNTHGVRSIYARRIPIQDKNGDTAYILGVVDDITERRAADARIAHLAHYDSLTGLPNRALFHEQLERRIAELGAGQRLAVLYLDLDHFKSVNDTLGHTTGDELLRAVATRLKSSLDDDDLLSRLSGDEFAIVLSDVVSIGDAYARARLLRRSVIDRVLDLGGHRAVIDLSVGIALAPDHGTGVSDLLKNADLALHNAKLDGRATCRHFEPEMNARMTLRRDLEMDLRRAINTDQLEVHYQPVVTLQGGQVTGCEALARWRHPRKGMISPAEFIPVAEDTGLISAIGERVLWQACRDAADWPDDKKIAVNVSTVQLRNPEFPKTVERCLKETGLKPQRLELEMTESVLMQNTEAMLETLTRLQETGVRISLDDFGTGYSSLSYLRRFPFNRIKIDRSFVTDIAARPDALAIVRTILMLAESLGMTTTAEGVETDDQRTLLKAIGCHEMQGFLFSRAVPADAAVQLMRDGAAKDTAAA
jgi:diguanylate cyclase (GGDEF)-like protein/PAS domain S-box-containing protein